ncbi:MAG TPA: DUF4956 domain-containing protein [Candidatus Limnocylindria bacterium]|nr:DUF4956 domain-containing protein [Candidatus Limnocylindria bacterium]
MASGDFGIAPTNFPALALGLLMAFSIGHVVSWVYMLTHAGLSYSRSFVNALILMPTIVALVMNVLSNNLIMAFGMMAVFAVVRFRNILRDTLDTVYVLTVIVLGMACGSQKFTTAIAGCALIVGTMLYLWMAMYGSRHRYDLIVNLHWARPLVDLPDLARTLGRHSRRALCASQRSHEGYEGTDLSYRLLLRNPQRVEDLLVELREIEGVSRVSSMQAEDESEL